MAYTIPLGYDAAQHAHPQQHQHHGQRPQHVRSSSAGMMGVHAPVESYGYPAAGPVRTDSPMPGQGGPPGTPRDESGTPSKKGSRFRLPTGLPTSPSAGKRAGLVPMEYDPVDFDTCLASFDDELLTNKHQRCKSKDDAWVDILVAMNSRHLVG